MATSGLCSFIHCFENSKPLKMGCQYGWSCFFRSIAAAMAGTWEVVTPAVILAMCLQSRVFLAAVAGRVATAFEHHLRVFLLRAARHDGGDVLEGMAIGGEELGEEVDVPALLH